MFDRCFSGFSCFGAAGRSLYVVGGGSPCVLRGDGFDPFPRVRGDGAGCSFFFHYHLLLCVAGVEAGPPAARPDASARIRTSRR
jgi:hypothetical protein